MDFDRLEDIQDTGPDWSVSRLHTAMQCGKKYYYKYRQRIQEPATPPLAFGTAVHNCIYTIQSTDTWDDGYVQRLWSDQWYEAQKDVDWDKTMYRKNTYDTKGPKILESYIAGHREDQWLKLEEKFRYDPKHGLPMLRGTFDKIQRLSEHPDVPSEFVGRLAVIDYKTSKNPPDKQLVAVDPQLTIYHEAALELFNEDVVLGLHHLPTNTIYWSTRNKNSMDPVRKMLEEAMVRVDEEMFERNIDYHCRWCPFKDQCFGELLSESTD